MKKIAVIIPNYNGFSYSERCFQALENQTFKDFEVCVVDDCSTDNSYTRLLEYASNSPLCMQVIRSERNMGPGHSRKVGIDATDSEWIAFCDIDDWYDEDFLETQLKNAEDNGSDLVMCDHKYAYGNGTTVKSGTTNWCRLLPTSTETVLAYAKMSLCRLLVKRELFNGVTIPEIYYGEDAPVTIQLIVNSQNIFVDYEAHYNYMIREGSASASINPRASGDYLQAYNVIQNAIATSFPEECSFIGTNMVLYGTTLIVLKGGKDFGSIRRIVTDFEKSFPEWYANKYMKLLDKKKKAYLWALRHRLILVCKGYARLHAYLISKQARG